MTGDALLEPLGFKLRWADFSHIVASRSTD